MIVGTEWGYYMATEWDIHQHTTCGIVQWVSWLLKLITA